MSFSILLIVVLFSFFQLGFSVCKNDICGIGSTFGQTFYDQAYVGFFSAYYSSPNSNSALLQLTYDGAGSGAGRRAVQPARLADYTFGASDVPFTSTEVSNLLPNTARNYPLVLGTLAIQINKPAIATIIASNSSETFVLSRDVLVDIFLGNIRNWNDTRIVSLQSPRIQAVLVNDLNPIIPLVRAESSGSTNVLTTYFSSVSPFWNTTYGVQNVFPTIPGFSPLRFLGDVMVSAIEVNENAIAYMPGASVNSVVSSQTAAIQNFRGEYTKPNVASLQGVSEALTLDSNFVASQTIDLDLPGAYPLTSPVYLLTIQNNNYSYFNCSQRRLLLLYISFIFSNPIINQTNSKINFITVGFNNRKKILDDLETYLCGPEDMLSFMVNTPSSSSYLDLWLSTGIIGGITFFLLIVAFIIYLIKEIKGWMFRLYAIVLVISTLLTLVSLIPWVMIPVNNSICLSRIWLIFFSVYMLLAATSSRTDILRATYRAMKQNDISKLSNLQKKFRSTRSVLYLVLRLQALLFVVQFIVLIVWTFVAPYSSLRVITDVTLRVGEYRCVTATFGYFIVEAILYTLLLSLGLYNLYSSWSLSSRTSQTKWLLISLYNFMVAGVIVIPLLYFVSDNKSTSAVISSLLVFLAVQAIFCFFIPGVIEAGDSGMKRLRRMSGSRSSKSRTANSNSKRGSQSRKGETDPETTS